MIAGAVDVMAEQPDLIVLGGDYVTSGDRRFVEPAADALAPLSAPHGVFAVLGNHDDDRDMPAALRERFEVLQRRAHAADDPRRALDIAGHPVLDAPGARHRAGRAGRVADARSCSRTRRSG